MQLKCKGCAQVSYILEIGDILCIAQTVKDKLGRWGILVHEINSSVSRKYDGRALSAKLLKLTRMQRRLQERQHIPDVAGPSLRLLHARQLPNFVTTRRRCRCKFGYLVRQQPQLLDISCSRLLVGKERLNKLSGT